MLGDGSAFMIRIPARRCAPPAHSGAPDREDAAGTDFRRVLLVARHSDYDELASGL
jgi:hypothetical protein